MYDKRPMMAHADTADVSASKSRPTRSLKENGGGNDIISGDGKPEGDPRREKDVARPHDIALQNPDWKCKWHRESTSLEGNRIVTRCQGGTSRSIPRTQTEHHAATIIAWPSTTARLSDRSHAFRNVYPPFLGLPFTAR